MEEPDCFPGYLYVQQEHSVVGILIMVVVWAFTTIVLPAAQQFTFLLEEGGGA